MINGEGEPAPGAGGRGGRSISWKVKMLARGLVLLVTLSVLEVVACVGGRILRERGTFYDPPSSQGFERYRELRDPDLGWPPREQRPDRDTSGARISPAFPDPASKSCLSIWGDSFAYGDEVDHEHAWGNVLSRRINCRVTNHGVTGYGTDQALLRYRKLDGERSPVALLGFPNENIHRNVNRFRALIVGKASFGIKPRFIVGQSGELEVLPIVKPDTVEEFEKMAKNPETYFEHDYFVPGGPSGVSRLSFPYTLSIAGLLGNFRIQAAIKREPSHAAFFKPEHPSRALAVTAGIARGFHEEAAKRGAWGALVFIPLIGDIDQRRKTGKLVHQPLIDELTRAGVPYLDPTDKFIEELAGKDACALFTKCLAGHYNERGYKLFADTVHDMLKEKGKL